MHKLSFPAEYNQVMPYLIVPNAAQFISFMVQVFGAVEKMRIMRDATLIMHAEISLGSSVIMLADATDEYAAQGAGMFIYVANCDASYALALAHGATSVLAPRDQEYGRSAGVRDAFGNTWWITGVPAG